MSSENYKLDNFPTLNEVFLVEDALQNADDSIITLQQLKKKMLRQVKSTLLLKILDYLEMTNKIVVTSKGITWIHNTNPRLKKAVSERLEL